MSVVIDYANWRPSSPLAVKAAGVVGVMRYVAPAAWGWPKALTKNELDGLHAAGLAVGVNFEKGAGDWKVGGPAGTTNGQSARTAMLELGLQGVPCAPSFDTEIGHANYATAEQYYRAFQAALGWPALSVYAEGDFIEYLAGKGLVTIGWQNESTSYPGNAAPTAHTALRQVYGKKVPGLVGDYDYNDVIKADWGQTPRPVPTPPPKPQVTAMYNPPLTISPVVSSLVDGERPRVVALTSPGGVYAFGPPYYGNAYDHRAGTPQPFFAGRTAAQIVAPGISVPGSKAPATEAALGYVYVIVATSGERYGFPVGGGVT